MPLSRSFGFLRTPLLLVMIGVFTYSFTTPAQALSLDGVWLGSTSCAGAQVQFRVELAGATGAIKIESPRTQNQYKIAVDSYQNRQGTWITMPPAPGENGSFDYLEGLLSSDQSSIRFFEGITIGDCSGFTINRRSANAPPEIASRKPVATPPNPESRAPTDDEVLAAIKYALSGGDESSASINNPISGSTIRITGFENLGCGKAVGAAGYICDYVIDVDTSFHSNEGTRAGDEHARGINALWQALNKTQPKHQSTKGRFVYVKSRSRWMKVE